jgi:mRNA interferase MazF
MAEAIKITLSISKGLFDQAETLAQRLEISQSDVLEMALVQFINTHPIRATVNDERVINQGDIFWVQLADAGGLEPGIPHPHVVVQDNLLNHSRIHTVIVCALTSNIKRASLPGNVLLEAGEANLHKPSVVEASKVSSVDKTQLGDYIGTVSEERISQIVAGMRFLQQSFFTR